MTSTDDRPAEERPAAEPKRPPPWPDAEAALEDDARTRRVLAIALAGGLANAAWLVHSLAGGDPLAAVLSGLGLLVCAPPTFLCARRLGRRRR